MAHAEPLALRLILIHNNRMPTRILNRIPFLSRPLGFLLLSLFFFCLSSRAQSDAAALQSAEAALAAAAPRAQSDPGHPIFHITPPGNWINDPNGPIFYRGYYHLFYQLDPFNADGRGSKYWGHVRSRDLAHWEPLPIALAPTSEKGETGIWSGSCTINGNGQPMIFYTSVTKESAQTHAEQWAAVGDQDLIKWQKCPENPVLSEALHGNRKIYEWRDPFVFHADDKTFLVAGGNLNKTEGGQAVANIYQALNPGLTQWKYRGVMFQLPDPGARTTECPNFFNIGDKYVLLCSPYGPVQYYIGDFNADTCRFQSTSRGQVDLGPNFYAPNTMLVPDGRRIMWGWVTGFPNDHGYEGCLTIPRVLSISVDGKLLQTPAPQLRKLRGKSISQRKMALPAAGATFALPPTNTFEISAEILPRSATNITISIKSGDASVPIEGLDTSDHKLNLRVFLDRTVLEVYVNDERVFTKVIPLVSAAPSLELGSSDGSAIAERLEAWPIKSIW
jgi:beta-fructofuranosidase